MSAKFIDDQNFKQEDFSKQVLEVKEFNNCTFENCQFVEADISGISFEDCCFHGCDLTLIRLDETAFREVEFINCKLMGLHFNECNDFRLKMSFSDSQLSFASFFKLNLAGSLFHACKLEEADFTEANLSGASFAGSDLIRTVFEGSNLREADFRSAVNYAFDPDINQVKGAKFTTAGLAGLLGKYNLLIE